MKILPLGDVVDFIGGGTPSKRVAAYYGGNIPWATVRDMNVDLLSRTEHSITVDGLTNSSSKVVPKGEVIIASRVGLGKVCILEQDTAINQDLRGLIPKSDKQLDRKFLFYWYQSVANTVIGAGSGATVQGVKLTFLRTLPIWLPPLKEQRRIVAVLDEAFAALDRARENVEANLADLPEALNSFILNKTSTAGVPCLLGDVVEIQTGFAFKSKDYSENPNDIKLVRGDNIIQGKFRWERVKRWPKQLYSDLPKYQLAAQDVLLAMDRTWVKDGIKVAQVEKQDLPSLLVQRVARLRCKDEVISDFIFTLLKSMAFENYVLSIQTGSGVPHISQKQIQSFEFSLPSLIEQNEICREVALFDETAREIRTNLVSKLAGIDDLRQSLLQRAFAGELTKSAPILAVNDNERDERFSTATLVLAFDKHLVEQRHNTFGHVKAQKTLHLTESIGGLDLGRQPQVRRAGPHDQEHFDRVEAWAKQNGVFEFRRRRTGQRGYDFVRGTNYDAFLSEAKTLLASYEVGLLGFLPLMVDMNTEEAEVFTTVHAAWNNLLVDGKTPRDDDIVTAARENWHQSKMDIARQKFFDAINKIRRHDLEPDGTAKYVSGAQESFI